MERTSHRNFDNQAGDCALPPPRTYFHVTEAASLEAILREGLVPRRGPRSAALGETLAAVYLFASLDALEDAASGWLADAFDEDADLALLAVYLECELAPVPGAAGYEVLCLESIGADQLELLSRNLLDEVGVAHLWPPGAAADAADVPGTVRRRAAPR